MAGVQTPDILITPDVAKDLAVKLVELNQVQQQNPTSLVEKAVQAYQDGQAEKSLGMLAGDVCPYTEQDVNGVLLENLSSQECDKNTLQKQEPKAGTPERTRYDKAQKVAQAVREYLESNGQTISDVLRNEVINYISRSPLFRDLLFDSTTGKQISSYSETSEAIARTLLRQPRFRQAIHRLFTERLDSKKRLEHLEPYEALRREVEALEIQLKKLPPDVTQAKIDQTKNDLETARQNLVAVSGLRSRLKSLESISQQDQRRLDELQLSLVQLETKIGPYLKFMEQTEQDIQALRTQLLSTTDPQQKSDIEGKIEKLEKDPLYQQYLSDYERYKSTVAEITTIESRIQEIQNLSQQIAEAESDFQQKKQEYEELVRRQASSQTSQERARLEAELERKKLELKDLEAQLTAERIRYASDVIAIPAEVAKEFLNEALGEAATHYKEEAKKAAEQQKAESEKQETERKRLEEQAIEKLSRRLGRKEKTKRGETIPVPDKKQARRLLTLLFKPSGLQGFINEVAKNKTTLKSYGLTDDEVKAITDKKNDPEFVKTVGQNLAKKILADYLLAGGRLSRDDIFVLADTEWGRSIIEDGRKLSEEQRKFLEKQLGKGVLTALDELKGGKTTSEWLKGNWWKIGGIIGLLILLGLIGPSITQLIPNAFSRG